MRTISSFKDFAESLLDFIRATSQERAADILSAEENVIPHSPAQNQIAPPTILPTGCRQHVDAQFNDLALSLFALQFSEVAPYRRFCESRNISPQTVQHWSEIPALPTSAFKELEISSLKPEQRTHVFHSSGTTEQIPSRHFHNADSLAIYEASLLPWFQKHFLADWDELQENEVVGPIDKPGMIFLTPPPALAPNSSLVHMFETVRRELGSRDSLFTGKLDEQKAWALDIDQTLFAAAQIDVRQSSRRDSRNGFFLRSFARSFCGEQYSLSTRGRFARFGNRRIQRSFAQFAESGVASAHHETSRDSGVAHRLRIRDERTQFTSLRSGNSI